MNTIIAASICIFLAGSCYFLMNWMTFFHRQPDPSVEDKFLAFTILIVATFFWVLLIPVYCFRLFTKLFLHAIEAIKQPAINKTKLTTGYSEVLRTDYKVKSQI
ncbi:hypothetical protein C7B80_17250 [Cyanosarcina cf. burmensis CCALA 770]|uniref:Uncharacterized protein n=1 Tax=Scytonema millei VB511283 TaxID=1245923 RepID=A0A9X5E2N7_9CYAN|nr:hypothetical protein [Scytonema millei VB511283]PSB45393.1 hypothetical protein C7B80_17250 [Cyanosarcina cf. burmensis CCALA 770]